MGGTAFAYMSPDGLWRNKPDLTPVNIDGKPIEPVKSSFKATIPLTEKVAVEDYLSHNIRIVYALTAEEGLEHIRAELGTGDIFAFDFSYRGGLVADRAFLLQGQDDTVWMAVGKPTSISFIGMQQQAAGFGDEEAAADDDEADLDFGMM
jgi:hypothetical protein